MLVTCLNCNSEFEKSASAIKRSPNHFCKRSCAASYNNRKAPKRHPEGKCRVCQAPIRTTERWCSEACHEQERLEATKSRLAKRAPSVVAWRQRLKLKALALKGGSCQACGYDLSVRALTFHHLDPSQKDFSISGKNIKSWVRVQEELKKCLLLCCRCHAEVHDGLLEASDIADCTTLRRRATKQQALEYLGGQCLACGYNLCLSALAFHHLDPSRKDFNISHTSRSWEHIRPELDKCILLCSRCHAEVHDGLLDVSSLGSGGGDRTPDQAITPIP